MRLADMAPWLFVGAVLLAGSAFGYYLSLVALRLSEL